MGGRPTPVSPHASSYGGFLEGGTLTPVRRLNKPRLRRGYKAEQDFKPSRLADSTSYLWTGWRRWHSKRHADETAPRLARQTSRIDAEVNALDYAFRVLDSQWKPLRD
jgi:hypothetical protein